ncbi:MAG: bifunctional adenosylcobinamide kinase/adenosylcobinamide-phosphate guanylyltransferase [Nitrospirae bacterium]|nr:bifunctional adenosylcobinamide kinase/adenosylcobinamide-phosphate guanylyltransferase [Candidatus Manganitrophaceae bacterium]
MTFILGGARSGKSRFALEQGGHIPGRRRFVATAQPIDDEMRERIARHREERGAAWETIEEPFQLGACLSGLEGKAEVVVVDCVTVWLGNLLCAQNAPIDHARSADSVEGPMQTFLECLPTLSYPLIVVSNEVGGGLIPETPLGRRFRELAGVFNQQLARVARDVYWMVAGLPQKIK